MSYHHCVPVKIIRHTNVFLTCLHNIYFRKVTERKGSSVYETSHDVKISLSLEGFRSERTNDQNRSFWCFHHKANKQAMNMLFLDQKNREHLCPTKISSSHFFCFVQFIFWCRKQMLASCQHNRMKTEKIRSVLRTEILFTTTINPNIESN